MQPYDPKRIEPKWQKRWETAKMYRAEDYGKKKEYILVEFPYPSGEGLHTGHVRSYTAMDIVARKRRMGGKNVLYPIGWDAFGLPTENFAIKTGTHPAKVTKRNTDTFRRQLKSLGLSFDWSREINTTDPNYYKWTQWIFLQLYKHGLAYKAKTEINWCISCKIGLANEEVVDGRCERCGGLTEKREKEQWMLRITKYADRLLEDLDSVEYLEKIKIEQRNWIGKSEGALIKFPISNFQFQNEIEIFTTRPDTIFGATFLAVSPELAKKWLNIGWQADEEVKKYVAKELRERKAKGVRDFVQEKKEQEKEKTGVNAGIFAINPANGEKIPVWVANYVLPGVGTGAIMAVPAHDERDFEFAKKYGLPIRDAVMPSVVDHINPPRSDKPTKMRRNVHAIVYDPKRDAYLALHSGKFGWNTVVIGGVEDGETEEEAAVREVREETGYTDLKFKRILGGPVQAEYFAKHKDENRVAITLGAYFELKSEKKVKRTETDVGDVIWVAAKDFKQGHMVNSELPIWLERIAKGDMPYTGEGVLANSGQFSGMPSEESKKKITEFVGGKWTATYKLRDWVFSRQRYWGEPIPMVYCPSCAKATEGKESSGWQAVPEKDLPVKLPNVKNYKPTDTGESPLANISSWVSVKCPKCKSRAKRETDVMPNWAGSSWYFLRYADPKNKRTLADKKKLAYWMPVDWYNGGMEHTTLHLLYSRFWNKFLHDIGVVPVSEPYKKRTSHGLILAEGGVKMSKSKGNVVNPDEIVVQYGADTLRVHEMFMGPFDQAIAWDTKSIIGSRKFLEKVWKLQGKLSSANYKLPTQNLERLLHQTTKKVSEDIEAMRFNTAISALMILVNELEKEDHLLLTTYYLLLTLLAPFAPHMTDELWSLLGRKKSIHLEPWPKWDEKKIVADTMKIALQVNGKVRAAIEVPADASEDDIKTEALENAHVKKWIGGNKPKKILYIKGRLVSVAV